MEYMTAPENSILVIPDNGGRRSGIERRQMVYTDYIPSRRAETDRRNGHDRRSGQDRRKERIDLVTLGIAERRKGGDRRKSWPFGFE